MIKVFELNENGRIELTKEDLETLLKEAHNEGYAEGSKGCQIAYPYSSHQFQYETTPWWSHVTCKTNAAREDEQK